MSKRRATLANGIACTDSILESPLYQGTVPTIIGRKRSYNSIQRLVRVR